MVKAASEEDIEQAVHCEFTIKMLWRIIADPNGKTPNTKWRLETEKGMKIAGLLIDSEEDWSAITDLCYLGMSRGIILK